MIFIECDDTLFTIKKARCNLKTAEDLIRENITFQVPSSTGWNKVYCEVCGDGTKTKGPRGGWAFSDGVAFYNCFNCGVDGSLDFSREYPLSKSMPKILTAFGIPKEVYYPIIMESKPSEKKPMVKPKITPFKFIEPPDYFYLLGEADEDDKIANKAVRYLEDRKVDPYSYPFYLSTGSSKMGVREDSTAKAFKNRIIIPALKNGKMYHYQARYIGTKEVKDKYLNADIPMSNVVYFVDRLFENTDRPLYVTEGFFDAYHCNGVSVVTNKLSSNQIEMLERSPREKIIVPDRKGDSHMLAEQAVELGWGLSVPDWGSCKDVNAAVLEYGKIYVAKTLYESISIGNPARLALARLKAHSRR